MMSFSSLGRRLISGNRVHGPKLKDPLKLDFMKLWTQTMLLPGPHDKELLRVRETFTPLGREP